MEKESSKKKKRSSLSNSPTTQRPYKSSPHLTKTTPQNCLHYHQESLSFLSNNNNNNNNPFAFSDSDNFKPSHSKMVTKKPRIVIIGAGMAGLTAANKLYTSNSNQLFDLTIIEGGNRVGGRINSSEFCGNRIEQGATWIHGIENSPVYKIVQEKKLFSSEQPWECMDGIPDERVTIAEGGNVLNPSLVDPISKLFKNLMDFVQGEAIDDENGFCSEILKGFKSEKISVGAFLRHGLQAYWNTKKDEDEVIKTGEWTRKGLEEAVFAMNESVQRTFTSADDLCTLDYNAESEYVMFPGEEITIAKGYSSVVEHLASVLPVGMIQFGRKVKKIEWQEGRGYGLAMENCNDSIRPVKLHFCDGSVMSADHVIVTVSLGVLKHGIRKDSDMFNPPLPTSKCVAISRLGYGVVNKVFLQISPSSEDDKEFKRFPFLQMAFHRSDCEQKDLKIPEWIRRTSFITPIYSNSRIVLSWFTGQEAIDLETLPEEEIIKGFTSTISNFLPNCHKKPYCNGTENGGELILDGNQLNFDKVLRTQWGTNPLFMGSYTYIAVGSSPDDMDTLAEPLPIKGTNLDSSTPSLQILFAGEATHRTHYSTTHGAYFSGLREASRILKHYNCV